MSKEVILSGHAPAPIGPYSQAIASGGMVFLSGQIPLDPATGNMITGGVEAETRQVMENLRQVLTAAGLDFSHVVKCSIFLRNMGDFPLVNQVYAGYFQTNPPARETVEVSRLPKDAQVEISCIAIRG